MSKKILFLTQKMSMGFGVSVVIHEMTMQLIQLGYHVEVGCLEFDGTVQADYPVFILSPDLTAVETCIKGGSFSHVVAHTSPYFEILPNITANVVRLAWEHGDPTPELFPFDGRERRAIVNRKRQVVYPNIDGVIAISEFIKADISWPSSYVIYNGCDHIKPSKISKLNDRPLVVGALMRLGDGEAFYKGNSLIADLVGCLKGQANIDFRLMGRGSERDAEAFRDLGVEVFLNATDDERSRYLADLDIFISMSLWEGFNLPLVEAAISGALPLALDTGAHPEVTPFIHSSVDEMARAIRFYASSGRPQLWSMAERNSRMTKERFSWSASAKRFVAAFM